LLNPRFADEASDRDFVDAAARFYEAISNPSLFGGTLIQYGERLRRGVRHILESNDPLPVRIQRCLNGRGVFAVPGLGPAFWSAVAQGTDPLRLPSWLSETVVGARRLGLIQRKRIWYGDLMSACDRIRDRAPRLTATHVDHVLVLASRDLQLHAGSWLHPDNRLERLLLAERRIIPLRRRLRKHGTMIAEARLELKMGIELDDANRAIAALCMLDGRLEKAARAWDPAALLQWIAWIWHDDDPLSEIAACERESAGAGRALTAAVLHVRSPEQYPLWDRDAAAGLARLADASVDTYRLYAEALAALRSRFGLHPVEAPSVLARLAAQCALG
jgi:hypothetical protein